MALVDRGALSLAFLDAPVMATPERLGASYEQLAADRGVPVAFLQAVHQALDFAPPDPGARAGEDDLTMLDVAELFRGAGVGDDATRNAATRPPPTPPTSASTPVRSSPRTATCTAGP